MHFTFGDKINLTIHHYIHMQETHKVYTPLEQTPHGSMTSLDSHFAGGLSNKKA